MADPPPYAAWSTDAWRQRGGGGWVAHADRLEAMLAPVLEHLFDHAGLGHGDRVLDVGCGRGATTRHAARVVGASGSVTAVDVSPEVVAAARRSASADTASGNAPIEWLVADAQRVDLTGRGFDVVISRFGVMFFDDPVEAFATFHRATRPGGRLAVATWRPRDACDFQAVGWQAITGRLIAAGYQVADVDPAAGPYAFGVTQVIGRVLADAGWGAVRIHRVDLPLYYGGPGASPQDAVDTAMGMAGLQDFLGRYDDHASELAAAALLDAFSTHHDGTGVRLHASILVTTATA